MVHKSEYNQLPTKLFRGNGTLIPWLVMSTDSVSDAWNPRRCIVYVILTSEEGLFQEIRKLPAGWAPTD